MYKNKNGENSELKTLEINKPVSDYSRTLSAATQALPIRRGHFLKTEYRETKSVFSRYESNCGDYRWHCKNGDDSRLVGGRGSIPLLHVCLPCQTVPPWNRLNFPDMEEWPPGLILEPPLKREQKVESSGTGSFARERPTPRNSVKLNSPKEIVQLENQTVSLEIKGQRLT